MATIKLVVTGDLELKSLAESLKSQFPTHRGGEEVIWDKTRKMNCSTSHRLRSGAEPSQPMLNLARAMLAEALNGKQGKPADLVIVIDDVELGNVGQEEVIAEHFRAAVDIELEKKGFSGNTLDRYKGEIRDRCSFHVLRPMVEAYFFGEMQALRSMGVMDAPLLRHETDVENFESVDGCWLPECYTQNQIQEKNGVGWWRHETHPKHYISHLLMRGNSAAYDETLQGASALRTLDWKNVPKIATDALFIRALFEDLADWFGVISPVGGNTAPSYYPQKNVRRANLVLRNL
ncbi:hypothetical protein G3O06_17435 [Burkholderia sp. Ac-20345]|uniref:hypothetical protein n=1 Tax=Burkholderia sp. Ac-20345 TaxID=2703891 RepID=UPI00197BEE04|nr:hypothetical protein [Burkholderia sp. Ac-20345]MBN3779320.1 hypothetical protein [Burkholderia sp. Ac-20345]